MKITLNEFYKRATAKGIKTMRGHDGPSQEWNIYFDNKKICNCWDDSYGGPLQITNYDGKSIEDIFNTIDKESTWDPNWEWHTTLELMLEEVKSRTSFAKDEKKGVCIGFSKGNYNIYGYNKDILTSLRLWPETKDEYQQMINDINPKTDGKIVNWEYLESCNINVPSEYRWSNADYVRAVRGSEPIPRV